MRVSSSPYATSIWTRNFFKADPTLPPRGGEGGRGSNGWEPASSLFFQLREPPPPTELSFINDRWGRVPASCPFPASSLLSWRRLDPLPPPRGR